MNKAIKILSGAIAVMGTVAVLCKISNNKEAKRNLDQDNNYIAETQLGKSNLVREDKTIYSKYGKRIIDVSLAFCGLVVLSPLFATISLAVIIDDPGPVFFKQKRVGKDKHFFELHKFRSMKMSTPHDVPTHQLDNPEQYITKVGKFLRKTSLDELPQIWDILRGKMSIIGPRPALWNQDDLVIEREKYGANNVMPGLTGWAQINGRDELEIAVKAKLDGEYTKNLGLLFDIRCFIGTIIAVIRRDGVVEGKHNHHSTESNNKKRILYICHYAGSPEMGMAFRPYYLASEWKKSGHSVVIIAADYSHLRKRNPQIDYDFQEQCIDGVPYVWIKTDKYRGNGLKRAITMFQFVSKLMIHANDVSNKYSPDIVITSSTYPLDTFAGQRIAKISKAKYIHEVHDMWPSTLYEVGGMSQNHPFVKMLQIAEDSAYKHCDELVALLPYSKDYMVQHGLIETKFHNIQNGIVTSEWESSVELPDEHRRFFEENNDKYIVGYFGGHAISNSIDTILDVAKKIEDQDIIFVLVGDGIEKSRLIKRKMDEEIYNLFFLPPVEKKAVPSLLKRFNSVIITVAPSPLYRFGLCLNKMYDSMMAGKPIICAVDAPNTLVDEYRCGITVKPDSLDDIVEAVICIKNKTLKEQKEMGERGKVAVITHFTYQKLANDFSKLFY